MMYGLALSILAIVTLSSFFLVRHMINKQKSGADVVNYAGRQRMLSQKIAKVCLRFDSVTHGRAYKQELSNALSVFTTYHNFLKSGQLGKDKRFKNPPEISALFAEADPYFDKITKSGYQILSIIEGKYPERNLPVQQSRVLTNEASFLLVMDQIVFEYAKYTNEKLARLEQIEKILLTIILITLTLEVIFIFKPVGRKMQIALSQMSLSEAQAMSTVRQVKEVNVSLTNDNRALQGVNQAFIKGGIFVKIDRTGSILEANQRYCEIMACEQSELIGKPLFAEQPDSTIHQFLNDANSPEQWWRGELQCNTSAIKSYRLTVFIVPILDKPGAITDFIAICDEITVCNKVGVENDTQPFDIVTIHHQASNPLGQAHSSLVTEKLTALKAGLATLSPTQKAEIEKLEGLKTLLEGTIQETKRSE